MAAYEGFLLKKGGGAFARWQPRFFELFADVKRLQYSKKKGAGDLGTVQLATSHVEIHESKRGPTASPFAFEIVTPDRTYELAATTSEERDAWCRALKAVCSRVTKYDASGAEIKPPPPPPAFVFGLAADQDEDEGAAGAGLGMLGAGGDPYADDDEDFEDADGDDEDIDPEELRKQMEAELAEKQAREAAAGGGANTSRTFASQGVAVQGNPLAAASASKGPPAAAAASSTAAATTAAAKGRSAPATAAAPAPPDSPGARPAPPPTLSPIGPPSGPPPPPDDAPPLSGPMGVFGFGNSGDDDEEVSPPSSPPPADDEEPAAITAAPAPPAPMPAPAPAFDWGSSGTNPLAAALAAKAKPEATSAKDAPRAVSPGKSALLRRGASGRSADSSEAGADRAGRHHGAAAPAPTAAAALASPPAPASALKARLARRAHDSSPPGPQAAAPAPRAGAGAVASSSSARAAARTPGGAAGVFGAGPSSPAAPSPSPASSAELDAVFAVREAELVEREEVVRRRLTELVAREEGIRRQQRQLWHLEQRLRLQEAAARAADETAPQLLRAVRAGTGALAGYADRLDGAARASAQAAAQAQARADAEERARQQSQLLVEPQPVHATQHAAGRSLAAVPEALRAIADFGSRLHTASSAGGAVTQGRAGDGADTHDLATGWARPATEAVGAAGSGARHPVSLLQGALSHGGPLGAGRLWQADEDGVLRALRVLGPSPPPGARAGGRGGDGVHEDDVDDDDDDADDAVARLLPEDPQIHALERALRVKEERLRALRHDTLAQIYERVQAEKRVIKRAALELARAQEQWSSKLHQDQLQLQSERQAFARERMEAERAAAARESELRELEEQVRLREEAAQDPERNPRLQWLQRQVEYLTQEVEAKEREAQQYRAQILAQQRASAAVAGHASSSNPAYYTRGAPDSAYGSSPSMPTTGSFMSAPRPAPSTAMAAAMGTPPAITNGTAGAMPMSPSPYATSNPLLASQGRQLQPQGYVQPAPQPAPQPQAHPLLPASHHPQLPTAVARALQPQSAQKAYSPGSAAAILAAAGVAAHTPRTHQPAPHSLHAQRW